MDWFVFLIILITMIGLIGILVLLGMNSQEQDNYVKVRGRIGPRGYQGSTGPINTGVFFKSTQVIPVLSTITGYALQTSSDLYGAWGMDPDYTTISGNSVEIYVASNGSNIQTGSLLKYLYSFEVNTGSTGTAPIILPQLDLQLKATGPVNTSGLTGVIVNYNPAAFIMTGSLGTGPAKVITASETGEVFAFNEDLDDELVLVITGTGSADYKGCTIYNNYLYVTNWNSGYVERYDSNFNYVNRFTTNDLELISTDGFAPFGISVVNGQIFVSYAYSNGNVNPIFGEGQGFIDVFEANGTWVRKFVTGRNLNAPYEMLFVPAANAVSGQNEVLVGNHGSGIAQRFLYSNGVFIADLLDQFGNPSILSHLYKFITIPIEPMHGIASSSLFNEQEGALVVGITINDRSYNPNLPLT